MGHKINPISIRLSLLNNWKSKWFAKGKDVPKNILEDIRIRQTIMEKMGPQAGISQIIIERGVDRLNIGIYSSRPGILIGRGGRQLESLRGDLTKILGRKFKIDINEVKHADLDANIVSQSIGIQISKRMHFRRVCKQALQRIMTAGAKGARIKISGRLNGAEIARKESFSEGSIPLSTFRADIDYAVCHAKTSYGIVGIKVWIYRGESN